MKPNIVYVWSSGLEKWEETDISDEELINLTFLYSKKIGPITLNIYQDSLNRFFGHTFGEISNDEMVFYSDGYCGNICNSSGM